MNLIKLTCCCVSIKTHSKGANAVEVDVTFGKDGDPLYTYHGPPCDCWRHCHQQEDFNEYLNYVRQIAIDEPHGIGRNLSILFLDLKLDPLDQKGKARAGIQLAKSITGNLFLDSAASHATILNNATLPDGIKSAQVNMPKVATTVKLPPLRLILSVNHVTDIELVQNFLHYLEMNNSTHLMQRIGFDVGMNDDLQQIESMWRRFGTALHLWQGDGFTNCFSPFYNLERLSRALGKRDAPSGYPAKVYHWTIDLHDRMRESLLLGVDAIMTNHPERVLTVLQEPEYAHDFRLADRHDEPFKKLTRKLVSRSGESARYQRSANAATGGFLGNLYDVVNSWVIYLREIPFLSYPTTTRLFSGSNNRKGQPSAAQASISVVKMSGQPEYLLDAQNQTSKQLARGSMFSGLAGQQDNLSSLAQTDKKQTASNETASYEGPKWYTVLTSNMLVSMMKVLLPVP